MRTSTQRKDKFRAKIVGDVAKQRTDAYEKQQKRNFREVIGEQVRIETEVKEIVGKSTTLLLLPYYIIFAKEVVSKAKKYKGVTLYREMEVLQNLWGGRGLDISLMNKIKQHYVPAYTPIIVTYFRLDTSLLDGPDSLA